MKNIQTLCFLFIVLGLLLTACTGKAVSTQTPTNIATPGGCATPESGATSTCKKDPTNPPSATSAPQQNTSPDDLARTDSQGAVDFEVKPLNLGNPASDLIFDVSMNTHSVDLSMNLASLATLTTDTGVTVQGTHWDGAKGGHHVEGKLSFPATYDGKPLLKGAKELTLTIKNVDAPIRIFNWQLTN